MIVCENIDRFLFPAYVNIFTYIIYIYVVLGLGSADNVLFNQHLLQETTLRTYLKHSTTLRTYLKHSYLQHMQERMSLPFVFPKTVLLCHVPVSIYGVFLDECL